MPQAWADAELTKVTPVGVAQGMGRSEGETAGEEGSEDDRAVVGETGQGGRSAAQGGSGQGLASRS